MRRKSALLHLLGMLGAAIAMASAPPADASGLGRLAPPPSVCPHQTDPNDPPAVQERAMRCLVDQARRGQGLAGLAGEAGLNRAAARKSADILHCDSFSHEACGREFTYWIQRFGYLGPGCSGAGENIAWGTRALGSVRSIFRAWMRSAGHRENILGPYALVGIGLDVGSLEGNPDAHVWTQEFVGRGC